MKSLSSLPLLKNFSLFREIFFYGLGGTISTLIHFMVAMTLTLKLSAHYLSANAIAFMVSSLFSYQWHRKLTFDYQGKNSIAGYLKFLMGAISGLIIIEITLFITISILKLPYITGQTIALILSPAATFLINKHWTFAQE